MGFDSNNLYNNLIFVCGQICNPTEITQTSLNCVLPPIITSHIDEITSDFENLLTPIFTSNLNLIKKTTTNKSVDKDISNNYKFNNFKNLVDLSNSNE